LACDDGSDGDSAVLLYCAQSNIRGVKSRKIRNVAWVRINKINVGWKSEGRRLRSKVDIKMVIRKM
jgi:hypothetical protein